MRRAQLDPGLRGLINTRGCIRKCALNFFGESKTDGQRPGLLPCCSGCSQVDIIPRPRKQEQQLRKSKIPSWARLRTRTDLIQWRKTRADQLFHTSFFQDEDAYEALMPTQVLDNLARDGYHIHTIDDLRDRIGGKWIWLERFGDEVLTTIRAAGVTRGVDIRAIAAARAAKTRDERQALQQLDANAAFRPYRGQPSITVSQKRQVE